MCNFKQTLSEIESLEILPPEFPRHRWASFGLSWWQQNGGVVGIAVPPWVLPSHPAMSKVAPAQLSTPSPSS